MDQKIADAAALLHKAGAHLTKHSGRTLLTHLTGTAALLRAAGFEEHVVLGGLYHSIYGTNAFKKQSIPRNRRFEVRKAIGHEAERLAYLFCSIERPRAISGAVRSALAEPEVMRLVLHLRGAQALIHVTRRTVFELAAIEVANLLEQGAYRDCPEFAGLAEKIRRAAQ